MSHPSAEVVMAMMVLDPMMQDQLIAERRASGGDRFDEVWEGVYMMAPLANNEHQDIQGRLAFALQAALGAATAARIQPGANVSDREDDWTRNYRCPDVVVVFPGGAARDRDTHWLGGPDFCAEIVSRNDRSRDKLEFYGSVGVRELLLVDRFPWVLELYRLANKKFDLVGTSDLATGATLRSDVVPVSFRLAKGAARPSIEVIHNDGQQRWSV